MTSPGAASAGNLHADIIPDVSGFTARLKTELEKLNLPGIKVRTEPDVSGFNARLRSALRALPATDVPVRATPTVTGFNVALRASLRGLPTLDHRVNATPSTTGFNAALRGALAALPNLSVRVGASPNLTGFNTALRSALAALPTLNVEVRAEPNLSGFTTRLRAGLGALTGVPDVRVKVDPNFAGFNARLRSALTALTPTPVVKVRIDPDMTGFNARLRAAVAAMGTTPTIKVKIEPDLAGFGGTVSSAARSGQLAGGAYAATFRSVIAAALRNLPEPTIGAATGPAEQAIRDLRLSLERLRDERIGVTITAEQAKAEIDNLRRDLVRLKAMSPLDVDVQANIGATELALANMERRLRDITRDRRFDIRPRVDNSQLNALQTALLGSTNRMQVLITAGLALGPAIVPAAAAAAAAIGAIGGAAISAGAGLGVGILALSGVVGAVKALSEAKNEAAKTNATLARQDKQAASGADQVRSAVASLANTRAQAASQARQSANAIADAERGLADAQRDALRAQQDITRAREDAKDALEDLNSSIASNATSIKQANLDLADAEAALAKVRNLPPDNRARIEAEIAYERAKQSIDDLTTRQGRLAEEKKRSDKAGIEGSQQVVAAQERISDAQRRVQDAERAVAEARTAAAEQARQSAFSIAQAQQAVVAAQRSVATSAVSAAATGGAAMDTLREKMANLSPEGQRFARFLSGLQPELLSLRQNAEQALPGFEAGLRALLPALPAVNDFVRRIATSLGEMGQATGESLNSAKLRPFFSYIDATAVPTLRELGEAAGNVGTGFANMVVGFGPVQRQITGGLVDMTQRFEDWSASLDRNNGFQRFLDYAITRGPIVMRTVSDIGGAVIHLLEASAPAGDVVLTILSGIAHTIEAIPVPVLATLLGVMTALRIASLLTAIPIGALGASLATLPGRLVAMTTSMGAARAGLSAFAATIGGPVTIAIAAATFGIGFLISQSAKSRAEIDRLKSSMDSYGNALKNGLTPEAQANAQAILAQDQALRGLVSATDRAGLSQATVAAGLNGDRAARQQVIDALNQQIEAEKAKQREARGSGDAETAASQKHKERAESLENLRIAFAKSSGAAAEAIDLADKLAEEQKDLGTNLANVAEILGRSEVSALGFGSAIEAISGLSVDAAHKAGVYAAIAGQVADSNLDAAEKAQLFGQILGELGTSATTQGATFDALAGTFNRIAESSINAHDKVQLLRRAMEQMYGAAIAQTEANEALIRAKIELTTQVNTNSAGFDLNKARGDENTKSILANRDALQLALEKAREKYLQDLANGVSQDVAREAHRKNIEQILLGIDPTQRNTQAVGDLVKTYGALPDKKTTEVTAPGLAAAIDKMIEGHAIQTGLSKSPVWTNEQIQSQIQYLKNMVNGKAGTPAMYKADGGLIPGWSPHSRADNIPAWLTAREFVQPVSTVDYYGVGVMEAIRQKRIPRELLQGDGYAIGGLVRIPQEWPLNFSTAGFKTPDIAALRAKLEAARAAQVYGSGDPGDVGPGPGFPPWPSSPSRQRGDSGVWKSVLNLVRSAGIPYNFGNSYRHRDPLWHGCVPMDTFVLTRRGWVRFEDVKVGEDETVGYNPETGLSEWTRIVGMHHYADAELWTISDGEWSADVTPGHKWLTDDGLIETRDLTEESVIRISTRKGDGVPGLGWEVHVRNVRRTDARRAEVFCPTTELGTWTARQGEDAFLTGNSGRAIDFMGYNLDRMAQFFMGMQGRVLELIHWSVATGKKYGITRGRIRDFPTQFPLHKNHLHIAMAGGGLVPNVTAAAPNLGPSLAQALGIPHLLRDQGGWIPPGLSIMDNRTGGYEGAFNQEQMRQLGLGNSGGGDRALVQVDNMYVTDTGPDAIADELFWRMKTR